MVLCRVRLAITEQIKGENTQDGQRNMKLLKIMKVKPECLLHVHIREFVTAFRLPSPSHFLPCPYAPSAPHLWEVANPSRRRCSI
jgi:hypothetical protein